MQTVDTRLDQIAHARKTLPLLKQIDAVATELADLDVDIVNAQTAADDAQREVVKSDQDVQLVRDRAARNRSRLDAGQGSAKELLAIQHELDSLAKRQSDLEDLEIEAMERADTLNAKVAELTTRREDMARGHSELEGERDAALGAFATEESDVSAGRPALVDEIGDELVGLYEKIRSSSGGLAAAELRQRRCGGCRLELNNVDLDRIRRTADDEVVRCEECRRIMVRTDESGL